MGLTKQVVLAPLQDRKKHRPRGRKDKPFAAIELSCITSDAWRNLNSTEALMYMVLKSFYRGNKEKFKAPFSLIRVRSRIKHNGTIQKAVSGLEAKGWIKVDRCVRQSNTGLRIGANEYELISTNDFMRW